jgi:hypothetical protein
MSSKQREALSDACYAIFNFLKTHYGSCYEEMANALDKAKAALAEPLKNCEVGTVEEQKQRFDTFCSRVNCDKCPLMEEGLWSNCAIRWEQMPYEKGKTDEQ